MSKDPTIRSLFRVDDPLVAKIFTQVTYPWEVLGRLDKIVEELVGGQRKLNGTIESGARIPDENIVIEAGARIEAGAYITGPAYIGPNVTIRHGAYVRSPSIFCKGSVLGHASECKNSLFLPGAKAPHFAYVGDSILGNDVNLGAGVKLSNLPISPKGTRKTVRLEVQGEMIDTSLRKFGAVLGDECEVGCNAVLGPGAIIGPGSIIYPQVFLRGGLMPTRSLVKLRQELLYEQVEERYQ